MELTATEFFLTLDWSDSRLPGAARGVNCQRGYRGPPHGLPLAGSVKILGPKESLCLVVWFPASPLVPVAKTKFLQGEPRRTKMPVEGAAPSPVQGEAKPRQQARRGATSHVQIMFSRLESGATTHSLPSASRKSCAASTSSIPKSPAP